MATKKTKTKIEKETTISEAKFTKEQILKSSKYINRKDVCSAVIPEDFFGTLAEVDTLINEFYERKVM